MKKKDLATNSAAITFYQNHSILLINGFDYLVKDNNERYFSVNRLNFDKAEVTPVNDVIFIFGTTISIKKYIGKSVWEINNGVVKDKIKKELFIEKPKIKIINMKKFLPKQKRALNGLISFCKSSNIVYFPKDVITDFNLRKDMEISFDYDEKNNQLYFQEFDGGFRLCEKSIKKEGLKVYAREVVDFVIQKFGKTDTKKVCFRIEKDNDLFKLTRELVA